MAKTTCHEIVESFGTSGFVTINHPFMTSSIKPCFRSRSRLLRLSSDDLTIPSCAALRRRSRDAASCSWRLPYKTSFMRLLCFQFTIISTLLCYFASIFTIARISTMLLRCYYTMLLCNITTWVCIFSLKIIRIYCQSFTIIHYV